MRYGFINNFSRLLATDLAIGATTMTLDGGGALLSAASVDLVYTLTLDDGDGTTEIVHVTAVTTNTLTVVRGQEGTTAQAWPTGSTVEMRVTAGVMGSALLIDNNGNVSSVQRADPGAVSVPDGVTFALAIGDNTTASALYAAAVGGNSTASAAYAFALGPFSLASGEDSVAIGFARAIGEHSVSIGEGSEALGAFGVAIGEAAEAYDSRTTAVGSLAQAVYPEASSFGHQAEAFSAAGLALGAYARTDIGGGCRINALPYLPATPVEVAGQVLSNSATRSSPTVAIMTDLIDLTNAADFVEISIPSGARFFVNAIDVVIAGSATPGGAPEIRIGPDDITPAAYLAATAVTATAVGERQIHTPLVVDGITTIRVETVTAGTGTLTAKIVFRGYVMEL